MISVIIPNWNGKKFLPLCLDSLRKQSFRDFETILVDNGSEDGSCDFVRENYPEVRVIPFEKNLGFSAAVNAGIKAARGDLVVLFNNDAESHPNWLQVLSNKAEQYPQYSFFASKILLWHQREILDSAGVVFYSDGRFILRGHLELDREKYDKEEEIFGVHGAAAMYRKSALDDVGSFDEDFFSYMEEADINMRMNLKGHRGIYIPTAVVYHVGSGTNLKTEMVKGKVTVAGDMSFEKPTDYGAKVSDFIAYHTIRNRWFLTLKTFPAGFIVRNLPTMLLLELTQLARWLIIERRWGIYFKALFDFLKGIPLMWKKRREIMRTKRISDEELAKRAIKVSFFQRISQLFSR